MNLAAWRDTLRRDIGYALRQFVRNPVFSLVAVVSLAIGIGANTAMFGLLNETMLRALPVREPRQLVVLTDPNAGGVAVGMLPGKRRLLSYAEFAQLQDHATTLSGLCAAESEPNRRPIRVAGGPQESSVARLVSEDYFSLLGVGPAIGRVFSPQEATAPGKDPYVVLSYEYWQRRFGGKTSAIGTPIRIYGTTFTVIGVAAPNFRGASVNDRPDLWVPMMMQPLVMPGRDWLHEDLSQSLEKVMWLHVFGRLKPGVDLAKAQTEVDVLFRNILETGYPASLAPETRKQALSQKLVLREASTGTFIGREDFVQQLLILWTVSALVLLIACGNVANLLLARARFRSSEVGVRLSVGASRPRLIQQFLTESVMLGLIGSLVGLAVAWVAESVLATLLSNPKNPLQVSPGLDWRVLSFTTALALITGILFGLAPALRGTRVAPGEGLRETSRSTTNSMAGIAISKALVVAQVALSLLLVVGAGLFLRTLAKLQAVDLGYPKEELAMFTVDGVTAGYKDIRLANLWQDLAERIGRLPGVRGVTYSMNGLLGGSESADEIDVEGFAAQKDNERFSRFDLVGPGYFSTVGIPMLLGREIGQEDTSNSPHVCVINEAFSKLFFSGKNPIGRHVVERFGDRKNVMEVIGVARDAHDRRVTGEVPPRFYAAMTQGMDGASPWAIFEIRTSHDEDGVLAAARKTVFDVNQDLPIEDVRTLQDSLDRTNAQPRMIARLCAIFGGLALLLAATGLYGVLSYSVARRTNEIAIRIALGAGKGRVIALVLREMGFMIAIGLAAGIIFAAFGMRLIASRLYGVGALDPLTVILAVAILSLMGFAASCIPALRATRVSPIEALRCD